MRRGSISSAVKEEESEINMTPMLDVVFIMLIFFIVTANFIKEPNEINKTITKNSTSPTNEAKIPPEIYLILAKKPNTDPDEFTVSVAIFN